MNPFSPSPYLRQKRMKELIWLIIQGKKTQQLLGVPLPITAFAEVKNAVFCAELLFRAGRLTNFERVNRAT